MISLILPTLNEEENLVILLPKIQSILTNLEYEIIIVDDDSDDQTREIAETYFQEHKNGFVYHRKNDRGLSASIYEGFSLASGDILSVMDADMQHDEAVLPLLIDSLTKNNADICIASRNISDGGYGDLHPFRRLLSKAGIWIANFFLKLELSDPMSGYFAITRTCFYEVRDRINPRGFKILLELVYKSSQPKIIHISYQFKSRQFGTTKLTPSIGFEYLLALIDLKLGWVISFRFIQFGIVGFFGACINFLFYSLFLFLSIPLFLSIVYASIIGIFWSFLANNFFTFSESRYLGRNLIYGITKFAFFSIPGMLVQLITASILLSLFEQPTYSLAYSYLIYVAAVIFGAAVNYKIHLNITWKRLGQYINKPWKR